MSASASLPVHLITRRTVSRIIERDYQGCVNVIREAYLSHARGHSLGMSHPFLRFPKRPEARIIALPAYLGAPWNVAGIKWIASFPENIRQGIPRASAVMVLNNVENGYPFAIMEASAISAARTAASAVLAASLLHGGNRRARSMGLVGNGVIARSVYCFLVGTGWQVDEVCLFDIVPERAEQFRSRLSDEGRSGVRIAAQPEELLESCDLIVFATVASKPHIGDTNLFAHLPTILHLSLRDLAPEILLAACNVVDDVDHVTQAATSAHLAEQLSGNCGFICGTLADVIEGRCTIDRSKPVIFSPFGLGVLDIALGKWVCDQATAEGDALLVEDFFGELED